MKKYITLLLIIYCSFLLCSCNENSDYLQREGVVYAKEYVEAGETKIDNSSSRYYSYTYVYDDQYIIYVKYKEEFSTKEDVYKTFAFYVRKDIYDNTNIGDTYLYNSEKDSFEKPIKEEVKEEK